MPWPQRPKGEIEVTQRVPSKRQWWARVSRRCSARSLLVEFGRLLKREWSIGCSRSLEVESLLALAMVRKQALPPRSLE